MSALNPTVKPSHFPRSLAQKLLNENDLKSRRTSNSLSEGALFPPYFPLSVPPGPDQYNKNKNVRGGNGNSPLAAQIYNRVAITPSFPQWNGVASREKIEMVSAKWKRICVQMEPYYERFDLLATSSKYRNGSIMYPKRDSMTFEVPVSVRVVPALKGFGVFSDTFIPKGTVVYSWRYCNTDDVFQLNEYELKQVLQRLENDGERSRFLSYCYSMHNWPIPNVILLEMSIGRFVNHSDHANISNYNVLNYYQNFNDSVILGNSSDRKWLSDPTRVVHWDCISLRDIQKGEEITQNYNELDTFQWPWFIKLYERYEADRFEEGEWVKGSKNLELLKKQAVGIQAKM